MSYEQEEDENLASLSDYYMSNEYLYWTTLTQLRMVVLTLLTTELREFIGKEFIENKPTALSTIEEGGCIYKYKCVIITETMQQINQTIETVLAACELDMDGTVVH
jgi:hypothetical protein